MEDILTRILKDSPKFPQLKQCAQNTLDFLNAQHGLMRSHPYELREKCLDVFQLALDTKHSKLTHHAVAGLQRIVWDKSFQTPFESDNEERWLTWQVLQATTSLASYTEDLQQDILKVYLQLACSPVCQLTTNYVLYMLSLCMEVYPTGSSPVQTAALTAASQTLKTFITMVQTQSDLDQQEESEEHYDQNTLLESMTEEIMPVMGFICKKLKEQTGQQMSQLLLLQSLLTLFTNLNLTFTASSIFLDFVWQQLCPLLVSLLGSPLSHKIQSNTAPGTNGDVGRGSGCIALNIPSLCTKQSKVIYSVAVELVRLLGDMSSLRPVLESLFHRMLLYPPPQCRLEPLKALREIFKNPKLLINFVGPPYKEDGKADDLGLLKIAIDSLTECCQYGEGPLCFTSISCVVSLLTSLELITQGKDLIPEFVNLINCRYEKLEDVDKHECRWASNDSKNQTNFVHNLKNLILQNSQESLNEDFVDIIEDNNKDTDDESKEEVDIHQMEEEEDKENSFNKNVEEEEDKENSFNKNVEEEEGDNDSSLATEGPEEETAQEIEEDEDYNLEDLLREQEARREKVPRTLLEEEDGKFERDRVERLCESDVACAQRERQNVREFFTALQSLLPKLLAIRSSIEVDQALQEFASNYCEELWRNQDLGSSKTASHITILNADGLYLSTYNGLLLNLKLLRNHYYENSLKSSVSLMETLMDLERLIPALTTYQIIRDLKELQLQLSNLLK